MDDHLSDDQQLIRDSLARFLADRYDFDARRAWPATRRAFDPAIWSGLGELGLLALILPENAGGLGGTALDALPVMELCGRHLLKEPMLASAILAATALASTADERAGRLLASLVAGDEVIALAHSEEGGRYALATVATEARAAEGGYVIDGAKIMVQAGPIARRLLVSARTDGAETDAEGISLFLIDADAPGITRRDHALIDGTLASDIVLDAVRVPGETLLGKAGAEFAAIEAAYDLATVAACAEAVGIMRALLEKTTDYMKTRVAFGQPLARQQVIQHRLVDMATATEYAAAMTRAAAAALAAGPGPAARASVSAAKALAGRESRFVAQAAVQLHGAIGYTDELDVGHYFRRLTTFHGQFGDPDHHRERYLRARLAGGQAWVDLEFADLTDAELAFQREVREFLAENVTAEMVEARERMLWAYTDPGVGAAWQAIVRARGWGAPNWPEEHGGAGWTANQHQIWALECARARAPLVANMGSQLCAPCIMGFGTDAQKAEFLPGILSGADVWAQGYSEPGAGSDLASLKTRAARDGDDYVVNGSKIWTTYAHHANRIFCLVRTSTHERKQQGITFLLIDMDTPGITVRPILNLAGDHDFNQVFLDDVRVPVGRRLGAEGDGWAVARHLLKFEHAGNIANIFELGRRLEALEQIARRESDGTGGMLWDRPDFRRDFADVAMQCEAVTAAMRQMIGATRGGGAPSHMAALFNIRQRETGQRLTEMMMDALGPRGAVDQGAARDFGSDAAPVGPEHARMPTALYLTQRAATLAGGTPEIHRNNLARQLLG